MVEWLEAGVGIVLFLLGNDIIRKVYRERVNFHTHRHGKHTRHFHAHSHQSETSSTHRAGDRSHRHDHQRTFPHCALSVGLMHGMAGSAALIVLSLQSTASVWQGLIYIGLFGMGSIVGMALFSMISSIPLRWAHALTWVHNGLQIAIGVGTMALACASVTNSFLG